jgi:hypothetical protein
MIYKNTNFIVMPVIKYLLAVFLILNVLSIKGQDAENYSPLYRLDTRINILAPHPLTDAAFNNTFNGVYTVNVSENIHLFQGFYVGVCVGNSLYQVPQYSLVSGSGVNTTNYINTMCQLTSFGLDLGYDYYFSPKGYLSPAMSIGESFGKFTSIQMVNPVPIEPTFNAPYVQVSCGLNFLIEHQVGLGFTLSFSYLNHNFNPYDIALNQYKAYSSGDIKGNISFFELGFTIYIGYLEKKK